MAEGCFVGGGGGSKTKLLFEKMLYQIIQMIIFIILFFSTYLLNVHCLPGKLIGTEVVAGSKIKILALMELHIPTGETRQTENVPMNKKS